MMREAHITEECKPGLEYGYMINFGDVYRPWGMLNRVFKRRCDASRWARRNGYTVRNWWSI